MPSSSRSEFTAYVLEQMGVLMGDIQAKRMFGGFGIFRQGLMFAVVIGDELYFKADELNLERFRSRGLKPFSYQAKGRTVSLGYCQAPAEVFDDPHAMAEWAGDAYACAVRRQKAKSAKPRASKAA